MTIGVPGLGWDVERTDSPRGRAIQSMKNAKVIPYPVKKKKVKEPRFSPQQLRSIKNSPKGKLPRFLNEYVG